MCLLLNLVYISGTDPGGGLREPGPPRAQKEKLVESQKGSMDKFFINNKQNITQNLDENITNEQEIYQKELEELEYKNLISQFASQKARKIYFK